MSKVKYIISPGDRFGRWEVVRPSEEGKRSYYWCKCLCGKEKSVPAACLRNGDSKSCGCLHSEIRSALKTRKTHGACRTRAYRIWTGIQTRCFNPRNPAFKNYGGRGLTVCDRWRGASGYTNFIEDMGQPPDGMTLERIDNNLGYTAGNCCWATWKQQNRNRRSNRYLTHDGRTQTVAAWSEETGIQSETITARIDKFNWGVFRALTTPTRPTKRRQTPRE